MSKFDYKAYNDKYYEENKERLSLKQKQRWIEDEAFRDAHERDSMKYYEKRKDDPEYLKRRTANNKRSHDARKSTPKYRFQFYIHSAKERDITFNLTTEEFMIFWQKPCTYCAVAIPLIGLDRIDNDKGYEMGNIVPCCRPCNVAKQKMSVAEFTSHITSIYNHTVLKIT